LNKEIQFHQQVDLSTVIVVFFDYAFIGLTTERV